MFKVEALEEHLGLIPEPVIPKVQDMDLDMSLDADFQRQQSQTIQVNLERQLDDLFSQVTARMQDIDLKVAGLEQTIHQQGTPSTPTSTSLHHVPVNSMPTTSTPSANQTMSVYTSPLANPQPNLLKPRDIKPLELTQLQGLESSTRLHMFFQSVEKCTPHSDDRVQIAMMRMGVDLSVLVHSAKESGLITSWDSLKKYLLNEFEVKLDFHQAWQRTNQMSYDWTTNPHSFIHQFKCFFASIQGSFPNQALPNRDRLLKQKLVQGFPKINQEALTPFMDRNVPIENFVTHVQHQRDILEHSQVRVNAIPADRTQFPSEPSTNTHTSNFEDSYGKLASRMKKLEEMIRQPSRPQPRSAVSYCAYCRSNTHNLKECTKKPAYGCCFDCHRHGCRRGKLGCPGRSSPRGVDSANWRRPSNSNAPSEVRNTSPHASSDQSNVQIPESSA